MVRVSPQKVPLLRRPFSIHRPLFTGDKLVGTVFTYISEKLWPEYKTFIVNARYKEVIDDYVKAVSTLPPRSRRGIDAISGSKDQLARLFGYQSNVTFETKAKTDLQYLINIESWKGDTGKIRLTLHPLEEAFLDALRNSDNFYYLEPNKEVPALNDQTFLKISLSQGYRAEEIGEVFKLLVIRGYVRLIRDKNLIVLAIDTRPATAIAKDVQFLLEKSKTLARLIEKPESAAEVIAELEGVMQRLESDLDDEELSQIDYRCSNEIKKQVEELLGIYMREGKTKLAETSGKINNMQNDLFRVNFDEEIKGNLGFVMHLEELRMDLQNRLQRLNREVTSCENSCSELSKQLDGSSLESDFETYASKLNSYVPKVHSLGEQGKTVLEYYRGFREWKDFNNRASTVYNSLRSLRELRQELTHNLVPEIQEHFNQQKFGALLDCEVYEKKLKEIENKRDLIFSQGSDEFSGLREKYESLLRNSLGVERASLRGEYSFDKHQTCYEDLYSQVKEKVQERAAQVAERIRQMHADLLKVTKIIELAPGKQDTVGQLQSRYAEIQNLGADINATLTDETIKDIDAFQRECEIIQSKIEHASRIKEDLELVIQPVDVEPEEQEILEMIDAQHSADMTEILVKILESKPDTQTESIISRLASLYRKNRIKISVTKIR